MNEIKHTPAVIEPSAAQIDAFVCAYFSADVDGQVARHIAGLRAALNVAPQADLLADALLALEMVAADADAGSGRLTSGVRAVINEVLTKAGRKAAPEPVRHITMAGGAR
ncbi:hypothetical protein [Burkholderia cenocepacia]|uniref:hypothetical protein n=1 Tax=Burkholderia cenocepacia TaxID=95486 RepID=UPI002018797F|nr:hypothetical protein [Burkholderia cenocepacia]MCO1396387.1 hypothetical protein [Burkholderia cenocepacia]MCO1408961.1 hypothetical protein [Burkholderia cenocepacia]UQN92064.1 hypothetical protein L0Z06_15190 [Burkholderia cenocepacia]UQN99213.1 hypothetical protein L0Z39_16980 [Burkholderia cenocepacia]UQP50832.1 hypothetical protein L0Y99_10265 [Burkholderia cenocepacia]